MSPDGNHGQSVRPALPVIVPTLEQQKVLLRISAQRERIRERRAARFLVQQQTLDVGNPGAGDSLILQGVAFAKQHPAAVAAVAAAAMALGPRRLIRWMGVALPWIVRLRR
ncbi:hypothetical protein CLU86_1435 [Acidovorax sp. 62]|uniref:hypothetical protein n=1 Tax=Acidovorax sp. 62 TaxID=2035203 RepID=UPI000C1A452B|nr:hypothetical protein [Acidovorax sp. 62]PIF90547.1 hypothetical protein CLU86_1435 [Acidovorax sp. 62]